MLKKHGALCALMLGFNLLLLLLLFQTVRNAPKIVCNILRPLSNALTSHNFPWCVITPQLYLYWLNEICYARTPFPCGTLLLLFADSTPCMTNYMRAARGNGHCELSSSLFHLIRLSRTRPDTQWRVQTQLLLRL
jgi:hypothetical protein